MIMNEEVIRQLAHHYFAGNIPSDLQDYLFDRYGEEPLEGDWEPQFFFPKVIADINRYLQGSLDTRPRTELEKLKERYEELSGIVSNFSEDIRRLESENQYLADFIHWMHLYDNYRTFRSAAHEARDVFGFTYYTV